MIDKEYNNEDSLEDSVEIDSKYTISLHNVLLFGAFLLFAIGLSTVFIWYMWLSDVDFYSGWGKAQQITMMLAKVVFWSGIVVAIVMLMSSRHSSVIRRQNDVFSIVLYLGAISVIILAVISSFCLFKEIDSNESYYGTSGWQTAGSVMWNLTEYLSYGAVLCGLAYVVSGGRFIIPIPRVHREIVIASTFPCPNCGNRVQSYWKSCPHCKEDLLDTEFYCSNCNRDVMPDWEVCPYCGDSLEMEEPSTTQEGV